jgi:hypothetical protein
VWFYWIGILVCGILGSITVTVWTESGFQEAKTVLIATGIVWLTWLIIGLVGRIMTRKAKPGK